MIRCIAIDDEPLALEVLEAHCSRLEMLRLERCFTNTKEALAYLHSFPVDLIFLDVQMPDVTGLDFYKSLAHPPLVILTTAYSEFAVEGFNINAVDFLLKPILFDRFTEAVKKATEKLPQKNTTAQKVITVRSEYALVRIPVNEILYIETLDDYIKIHIYSKPPVLTLMSLKSIIGMLPEDEFRRVHRSYVVAMKAIEMVRGKMILIAGTEIPISRNFEHAFFEAYTRSF